MIQTAEKISVIGLWILSDPTDLKLGSQKEKEIKTYKLAIEHHTCMGQEIRIR